MYNIVLINPPRENLVRLPTQKFVDLGEISAFPPVGLMYIAAALRQRNPDFHVTIIDAVVDKLSYAQIVQRTQVLLPDIVGVTAFTYTFYDVVQTARAIKEAMPRVPVAIGGSHMYIFAQETMTHSCFDYGIVGDGEAAFAKICQALYERREVPQGQGLYMRQGLKVVGSGATYVEDLDAIAIPAIDLINPFSYYSTMGTQPAVGTICTSRGCPFRCTFCQVPKRPYRARAMGNILEEINLYRGKGIHDFFFFDDLFNVTKQRVIEFCDAVLRNRLKIGWMFRGRIDQIDADMLRLCRKAGCHTISVGIEDATDEGLRAIKKNITVQQAFTAVRAIRAQGIRCSANWLIGFPHHRSLKDLERLLDTAIAMDTDYAQFGVLQCLPGSELFDQAVAEGGIDPDAWRNYVLNPVEQFDQPIWEKYLTKQQLFDFFEYAYKRYYLRPKVVARELFGIRSVAEARHKAHSFRSIFLKKRAH